MRRCFVECYTKTGVCFICFSKIQNAKDFTEPIDKVRDDSINDLIATIAKLDSNGVQVLPEGRTKTTSPQVHSSTDLSNTQEGKQIASKQTNSIVVLLLYMFMFVCNRICA